MWEFLEEDRIRVILDLSGIAGVNGSGYLAEINIDVVGGSQGDKSVLDISNGMLVDTGADEIPAEWIDAEITVGVEEEPVFDTGPGTYPSISGTHEGTIDVYDDITVEKLYTYPYAQIHHRDELKVVDSGILKCAEFTDANGNLYDDWIPAIALL
jgi:hypothetical protein